MELVHNSGADAAIVILHEIYGINPHISEVCETYFAQGYDVYCPNLLNLENPFQYLQQEEAYRYFIEHGGFDKHQEVNRLLAKLRPNYKRIVLLGSSVGASLAWMCADAGNCDCMIGYYGSRIRDYLSLTPKCPCLLLFAEHESSFDVHPVACVLADIQNTEVHILHGNHGFSDPYCGQFHPESAQKAEELTRRFLVRTAACRIP